MSTKYRIEWKPEHFGWGVWMYASTLQEVKEELKVARRKASPHTQWRVIEIKYLVRKKEV